MSDKILVRHDVLGLYVKHGSWIARPLVEGTTNADLQLSPLECWRLGAVLGGYVCTINDTNVEDGAMVQKSEVKGTPFLRINISLSDQTEFWTIHTSGPYPTIWPKGHAWPNPNPWANQEIKP